MLVLDKTEREKMNKNICKRILETDTRTDKLMLVPTGAANTSIIAENSTQLGQLGNTLEKINSAEQTLNGN